MIRIRVMLFSLAIVVLLMAVLVINNRSDLFAPEQVMVRPLDTVVVAPPPPPPPSVSKPVTEQPLSLDLRFKGDGPSLTLSKVNIKLAKPQLNKPMMSDFNPEFSSQATTIDLSGFALNELDQQPRLMTPLNIEFTPRMQGAGIKRVKVKLHVVIDEKGQVHLKNIIENPYPELSSAIKKLTKRARFSAPERQGKPVRAEFIWPLVLKES